MAGHLEEATRVHESLKGVTLATLEGTYVLGEIFYRRGDRYIVRAQRLAAPGCLDTPHVVVKLSLRTALPSPEERLLHKARKVAIDAGGDTHWVLQRLPNIIHNEDLQITPGSTQARVAQIIDDMFCHCESCEERVACEERPGTMRIVIMEELFPIKTLTTASDLAQVFFDVLNCHKWLYDHPRILHRDISMNNIMYRFDEQRNVCGVLNDMDLSSELEDPEDLKTAFLRRTGTPPFMAMDLFAEA
ncbi:hypothetical protein CPB85DRAFT_1560513 [Mucidula mucida]|nr:hypothetical protein CPB85DRAFT_1560513 [Mucidula mucida]